MLNPHQSSVCLVTSAGLRTMVLLPVVVANACVAGGGPPSAVVVAPESVWQRLDRPRPQPLADAPRISSSREAGSRPAIRPRWT